jgi:hypothetical protein
MKLTGKESSGEYFCNIKILIVIPECRKQRQENCELEASVCYIAIQSQGILKDLEISDIWLF